MNPLVNTTLLAGACALSASIPVQVGWAQQPADAATDATPAPLRASGEGNTAVQVPVPPTPVPADLPQPDPTPSPAPATTLIVGGG